MFLSDNDIKKGLKEGKIIIRPFNPKHLQPVSYDVTLSNEFEITNRHAISFVDTVNKIYPSTRIIKVKDSESFVLHPGESVLGKQREFVGVDREHLILLSGKSSLARVGLVVHNTAMLFNPCHYFYPAFELMNTSNVPLVLHPGMAIAQLLFARLTSPAGRTYKETGRFSAKNSNHFTEEKKISAKLTKRTTKTKKTTKK